MCAAGVLQGMRYALTAVDVHALNLLYCHYDRHSCTSVHTACLKLTGSLSKHMYDGFQPK